MILRSGKCYYTDQNDIYHVNIDFDEAQKEWNKNKIKLANGCYKYK